MEEEERQTVVKIKKLRKIIPCRLLFLEGAFNLLRLTFLMREYEEKLAGCQEKMAIIMCACKRFVIVVSCFLNLF